MRIRTMAWFVGGVFAVALSGVGAVACSSDTGSGTPSTTPEKDATTKDTGSSNTDGGTGGNDTGTNDNPDTSTGDDSSTPVDGGGAADCGSTPTLHVSDGGRIFCPFGEGGAPHD